MNLFLMGCFIARLDRQVLAKSTLATVEVKVYTCEHKQAHLWMSVSIFTRGLLQPVLNSKYVCKKEYLMALF